MQQSTKDQIKGTAHTVKGAVKEQVGQAANDRELAAKGKNERLAGAAQKKVGQVERVFEK